MVAAIEDLATLGISADLAVHYVRAGWLERMARGVYYRPNAPPALHPSVALLQRGFEGAPTGRPLPDAVRLALCSVCCGTMAVVDCRATERRRAGDYTTP
jgi:hypothetical protein